MAQYSLISLAQDLSTCSIEPVTFATKFFARSVWEYATSIDDKLSKDSNPSLARIVREVFIDGPLMIWGNDQRRLLVTLQPAQGGAFIEPMPG